MSTQDQIHVYDLAMRLLQLEERMAPERERFWDAADGAHPLHHRFHAQARLQAVFEFIRLPPTAYDDMAPIVARPYVWRKTCYPNTITCETLMAGLATAPMQPIDEADHGVAALMDAIEDAENVMQLTQTGAMCTTSLTVSRAALRGAWAVAAATRARVAEQQSALLDDHEQSLFATPHERQRG